MTTDSAITHINNQIIEKKVKDLVKNSENRDDTLQHIAELLAAQYDNFDWVGFYIADPDNKRELVLGPFVGEPTEHTRIPYGQGICGQAAETHDTFVVQDVSEVKNYLACSVEVEAEIVVPIMKNGAFVAELDIDSHQMGSITEQQQHLMERICEHLTYLF